MCCPLSEPDEGYTDFQSGTCKAEFPHKCCECGIVISVGEDYEWATGRDGHWGKLNEHSTCLLCVEIRDHFSCGGFYYTMLWEELENNLFPDMRMGGPCLEGLSPQAKGALATARLEWVLGGGDGSPRPVALPPWWRWWYGDAEEDEGRP